MTIAQSGERTATIAALRARIRKLETPELADAGLPAPLPLRHVLPGFRTGAVHSIEGRSLALLCLAAAIPEGAWSAIVGMPDVGIEAAVDLGLQIDRLVLVPNPGDGWADAVVSLAAVMPVVLAAAPLRMVPTERARLEARLRAASATLLVQGSWPGAATSTRRVAVDWRGAAAGLGRIAHGDIEVAVTGHDRVMRRARVPLGRSGTGIEAA